MTSSNEGDRSCTPSPRHPSEVRERLIVFTRYPEAGKTKTRLIPVLGAEGAAKLQREMTEQTLARVQNCDRARSVEIHFCGGSLQQMQNWLGDRWTYREQERGDLGQRMASALRSAFAEGMERAVIIGIDCPDLGANLMSEAFDTLKTCDLVLGRAADGGYYLIGLRKPIPALFEGIAWGTSQVLQQTVAIAEALGCAIAYLPLLHDIDTPEDLPLLQNSCPT
ncbi:MAG: TIGR04282 family arsenosugar biosynthesis glycosyltransferase [Cyanobacteriota bacterium]|nr:TIGR04282 family arsenosugar biosynthesis glycosyltransferase [Cyanobacteriota bacterium]